MLKILIYNNKDTEHTYIIQSDSISDIYFWFDFFTFINIKTYKHDNDLIDLSTYTFKKLMKLSKEYDVDLICLVSKENNLLNIGKEKEKNGYNV